VRGCAAVLLLLPLAACTGSDFSSGDQGFVSSDRTVTVLHADERKPPDGDVEGETVDKAPVSLEKLQGRVVVMPVWGSWCAPCRAEAPMLAEAARDLAKDGVSFLGINSRDPSEVAARAFTKRFDIPYPSIYDPDGNTLLLFRGTLPPQTIPAFVFVDKEGRVAARVLGEIDESTLYGVVSDVLGKDVKPPRGAA
jgi:thiol-disulfide isomerase/thioredoxin